MVNDLDDFHFVRALHGLRQFVVIHENQFARDGLQKIRLGQNADGLARAVQHGERKVAGRRGFFAHGGERGVFAEAEKFLVQHMPHGDGGAAERRGGGGVVRRGDDADIFFLRGLDGLRFDGDAAGDDEHAHAFADGDVLDVPAVADDDAGFFRRKFFQPRREGFQPHRADHQDQFLLAFRIKSDDEFTVERLRQAGK